MIYSVQHNLNQKWIKQLKQKSLKTKQVFFEIPFHLKFKLTLLFFPMSWYKYKAFELLNLIGDRKLHRFTHVSMKSFKTCQVRENMKLQ